MGYLHVVIDFKNSWWIQILPPFPKQSNARLLEHTFVPHRCVASSPKLCCSIHKKWDRTNQVCKQGLKTVWNVPCTDGQSLHFTICSMLERKNIIGCLRKYMYLEPKLFSCPIFTFDIMWASQQNLIHQCSTFCTTTPSYMTGTIIVHHSMIIDFCAGRMEATVNSRSYPMDVSYIHTKYGCIMRS